VLSGSQYSQTLSRGLAILEALAETGTPQPAGVVAARLGVHRAIAHRLLRTLEGHRLVRVTPDGRYALGYGLPGLSSAVSPDLQLVARPALTALAEATSATAFLSVVDGAELVTLQQVEPHRPGPRVVYGLGLRLPLDSGSPGLAILAARPRQPGERAAVTRARDAGYARSEGELAAATIGVSAAVRDPHGQVDAAVTVVFLKGQLHNGQAWAERDTAALVTAAAAQIAAARP
jgi:DNA-binding IclR family transcriptional regulator